MDGWIFAMRTVSAIGSDVQNKQDEALSNVALHMEKPKVNKELPCNP